MCQKTWAKAVLRSQPRENSIVYIRKIPGKTLSLFGPHANHYVLKGSMNVLSSHHLPTLVISKTDAMTGRSPEFHYWNQEGRMDGWQQTKADTYTVTC